MTRISLRHLLIAAITATLASHAYAQEPRIAQAPKAAATPQADVPPAPRFDIDRFDVQGNTLLAPDELGQVVSPYTGKSKDFADVQRALEAVQERYRSRGYGTVQVLLPEQELERGVIVLRVIEPKLGKVTIEGNKFFDEDNIRRSVPGLKEGETPNATRVGMSARLANENPSKRTTVLLRAGSNENEVDATVRIQDEKFWRGAVSFDNTGSPTTGNYRLSFGFQHANLFDLDHTLTMQYQLNPEPISEFDQLKVLGVAYRIPFYAQAASLDLLGAYSSIGQVSGKASVSGQAVGVDTFNLSGSGTFLGARYNQMLPRVAWLDNYEHRLIVGLDYKAFSNEVRRDLPGFGFNETPDTTVYPLSLGYNGTKRMEKAEFSFFGVVSHNIYPHGSDAFDERFTGEPPSVFNPDGPGAVRGVGRARYVIVRYGMNYARVLGNDVQMRAKFHGQWTKDALIAGEQFGIGGWDSVRGLLEREAASDRGYQGTLELYTPEVGKGFLVDGAKMRFLMFFDWGLVRQNHQQGCENLVCGLSASSIGVGVRVSMRQGVSLRLDYAQVLDGAISSLGTDRRFHGALSFAF